MLVNEIPPNSSLTNVYRLREANIEITGDPCNLIGSRQCDLFTNRTIFCSKSHPLTHQNENETGFPEVDKQILKLTKNCKISK